MTMPPCNEKKESQLEERIERNVRINDWLTHKYGLPEDGCISVGDVEELCQMIFDDLLPTSLELQRQKFVEGIEKYQAVDAGQSDFARGIDFGLNEARKIINFL